MKKELHYLSIFIILFYSLCLSVNAQVEYDFESDTAGNAAADVNTVQGTTVVSNYTENASTSKGLEMTEFGLGVNYASATLDNFPSTQDYSVTWKQTISFANGSRTGVILRTHGASRFPTIPQGYLFRVSAHTRSDWQHLQIIRYEPDGAATGSVALGTANLTRQVTDQPRWYRATVNGSSLIFEYSDNGDDANPTWITHLTATDATYQNVSGGTMFMQGFQAPIANTFFDDIQYNEVLPLSLIHI